MKNSNAVSKTYLRKRISYWINRFNEEAKARDITRRKNVELQQQIEWMQLKINERNYTIEILGQQYRKAFREMFAEETKKIMEQRAKQNA